MWASSLEKRNIINVEREREISEDNQGKDNETLVCSYLSLNNNCWLSAYLGNIDAYILGRHFALAVYSGGELNNGLVSTIGLCSSISVKVNRWYR